MYIRYVPGTLLLHRGLSSSCIIPKEEVGIVKLYLNLKVKYLRGDLFHSCDHIIFTLPAKSCYYATELRILSVTFPLCSSDLVDTTDNLSEKCPTTEVTDIRSQPGMMPGFVPSIIHNLARAAYSPNGFHKS